MSVRAGKPGNLGIFYTGKRPLILVSENRGDLLYLHGLASWSDFVSENRGRIPIRDHSREWLLNLRDTDGKRGRLDFRISDEFVEGPENSESPAYFLEIYPEKKLVEGKTINGEFDKLLTPALQSLQRDVWAYRGMKQKYLTGYRS